VAERSPAETGASDATDGGPQHGDGPRGAPDGRRDTPAAESTPGTESSEPTDTGEADSEPAPDERIDDDGVIIRDGDDEEDPAAAEARRTVLGETVPESAISREETERGDAVEYEIDEDAIPFSEDETDDDDEDDDGGFLGRLFRS
jgi:hypothetical protein